MLMDNAYVKKYIIKTGQGLQDVDHLKTSLYFQKESARYINGDISLDELDQLITGYYKTKPVETERTEEADIISVRIGQLISENSFTFTVGQFVSIHAFLFKDILTNAGKLRGYNFTKAEWVLDGKSVLYGDYRELACTLEYDFEVEKNYNYAGKSMDEIINHLSVFISNLWQIHAFEEGNTRTTAVFVIKYLSSLGFNVSNDTFAKNAWYFRNALVRANYNDLYRGITENRSFLILFLRNLILREDNVLKNRNLHVTECQPSFESRENRIIALMRENPKITLDEIAGKLGVSVRTVKSIVADLKDSGAVKRISGKKYGYWDAN